MEILQLETGELEPIRPLWEQLNILHEQLSTHSKKHFRSFSFEQRCRQLETREHIAVFVAREGSSPAGYCIASATGEHGEIDSIYLTEEYRGRSLGERLMAAAESWLQTRGVSKISVAVIEGNESAFGFYTKQGYCHRFTVFEKKV